MPAVLIVLADMWIALRTALMEECATRTSRHLSELLRSGQMAATVPRYQTHSATNIAHCNGVKLRIDLDYARDLLLS